MKSVKITKKMMNSSLFGMSGKYITNGCWLVGIGLVKNWKDCLGKGKNYEEGFLERIIPNKEGLRKFRKTLMLLQFGNGVLARVFESSGAYAFLAEEYVNAFVLDDIWGKDREGIFVAEKRDIYVMSLRGEYGTAVLEEFKMKHETVMKE